MDNIVTALQKQITDLSEKVTAHIISRHENDKHLAVSLQRIEDTTKNIEEQVKKTNGRVNNHDVQFTEILPKMNVLYAAYTQEISDKEKNRGKVADWIFKLVIAVVGLVLVKLNIINFNLPI